MRRRTRLCGAGILGLAASSVFATPVGYTDSHGDFVLPTNNKARDIWSASIDNDATNLYITINQDPASDQATTSFNFGVGITTGNPSAGGDVGSNTTTHGNPYIRAISIDGSVGGMLNWVGLFPASGAGTVANPWKTFGFNDYYNTPNSPANTNGWHKLSQIGNGVPMARAVGQTTFSTIQIAVPFADLSQNLNLSPGSTIKFDIYSTGTSNGQTAYDSLANPSQTVATATTQYNSASLLNYTIQAATPLSLTWDNSLGTGDGATWDWGMNPAANQVLNQNWNNSGNPYFFFQNNAVTFNDANNGHYNVTLNTSVLPASVAVNNSAGDYTISGTGSIGGAGALTKSGTSRLTLSTANAYTGGTNINGGTLALGHARALGFGAALSINRTPGATSVGASGILDLAGQALTEPITLNGGTLTNSSGSPASVSGGVKGVGFTASTPLSVDANVSFAGGGGAGAAAQTILALTQASLSLTSPGSGYTAAPAVSITGGGGTGATAAATISGGQITAITLTNGGSGFTSLPNIAITGGAGSGGTASVLDNQFNLLAIQQTAAGDGYTSAPSAVLNATSGSATMGTPVISTITLASTSSIGGVGDISISARIIGPGGLTKVDGNTLSLSAVNDYAGDTNVNGGTLNIDATAAIASGNVTVAPGATMNVNGSLSGSPNVNANGAVNFAGNPSGSPFSRNLGALNIGSGATVTVGTSASAAVSEVLHITSLSFADATAHLDLTNNELITSKTLVQIKADITGGSLMTNASGGLLGYADIGGGQVEVRFTIAGDANLDGTVDTVDFNLLASNFSQSGKDWMDGDFNYDGTIDTVDFNLLASKFSQSLAGPAALGGIVPEPTTAVSIFAVGLLNFLSCRRRCNSGRNHP